MLFLNDQVDIKHFSPTQIVSTDLNFCCCNDQFYGLILEQLVAVAWVTRLLDAGPGLLLGIRSHWSHFSDIIVCRSR